MIKVKLEIDLYFEGREEKEIKDDLSSGLPMEEIAKKIKMSGLNVKDHFYEISMNENDVIVPDNLLIKLSNIK